MINLMDLGDREGIELYSGNDLLDRCRGYSAMHRREYSEQLDECLRNSELIELFGIKGTGKTVSIYQAINKLVEDGIDPLEICYVSLKERNNISSAYMTALSIMLFNQGIKYLFLDEITSADDNLNFTSLYISRYRSGKSVVITGNDSAVFREVNVRELFGMVSIISTSYISYREFHHLYPDSDMVDYIRMGGVLGNVAEYGRKKTDEWKIDDYAEYGLDYFNTAILDNMFNYFDKEEHFVGSYPVLKKYYYDCKENELRLLVYQWMLHYSEPLVREVLRCKCRLGDLGNLLDRELASVTSSNAPEGFEKNLKKFLEDIECYYETETREYMIPIAVRYGFACELIRIACAHLGVVRDPAFDEAIRAGVEECLLEEVVQCGRD